MATSASLRRPFQLFLSAPKYNYTLRHPVEAPVLAWKFFVLAEAVIQKGLPGFPPESRGRDG